MDQFVLTTPHLTGRTYESAKVYASNILTPLIRGCILLNETLEQSSQKYLSDYINQCGSETLRSSELEAQIEQIDGQRRRLTIYLEGLYDAETIDQKAIQSVQNQLDILGDSRKLLLDKLRALNMFNAQSDSYFLDFHSLVTAIGIGLEQAQLSWQSGNQQFSVPLDSKMLWAGHISAQWELREINQATIDDKTDIGALSFTLNHSPKPTEQAFLHEMADFISEVEEWTDNDSYQRFELLLTAYPDSILGKVLQNDEFWLLADKLPDMWQTKLITVMAKYESFGDALALGKWFPKVNTIGRGFETFTSWLTPVKALSETALTKAPWLKPTGQFLGKVSSIMTWTDMGITFVSSAIDEGVKTQSIGKGIIGGSIETLRSIGPLEGMTIGATIGSAVPFIGTSFGALFGFSLGSYNTIKQVFDPDLYDNIKEGAYDLYDSIVDLGKGVNASMDTLVSSFSEGITYMGKSLGESLSSWSLPDWGWT